MGGSVPSDASITAPIKIMVFFASVVACIGLFESSVLLCMGFGTLLLAFVMSS